MQVTLVSRNHNEGNTRRSMEGTHPKLIFVGVEVTWVEERVMIGP